MGHGSRVQGTQAAAAGSDRHLPPLLVDDVAAQQRIQDPASKLVSGKGRVVSLTSKPCSVDQPGLRRVVYAQVCARPGNNAPGRDSQQARRCRGQAGQCLNERDSGLVRPFERQRQQQFQARCTGGRLGKGQLLCIVVDWRVIGSNRIDGPVGQAGSQGIPVPR